MKISKHTWIIITVVIVLFIVAFASQTLYFDNLTKKVSIQGVGPIFVGHLSKDLQAVTSRPFTLLSGDKEIVVKPEQLQTWIEPYHRPFTNQQEYRVNPPAIADELDVYAPGLAVKPSNARFGMVDDVLTETTPSKMGQELDIEASQKNIIDAMIHNESTASLVVKDVEPEFSLARLTSLNITSLVGEGTSKFTGSPAHRIHNIGVGAKRFDNLLIAPGASFSFVAHLGDVDATTGYLPELVIKGTKVIPEYGGGLCQVSTTLFRAAIYGGLQIDERKNHSFAVHYYSPIGFDSTIYPGAADLRFTNNTESYLFIQSRVEGTKLTFDLFGAPTNRTVTLDGPNSYDAQPDGSIKAVFTRTITLADGTQSKDTFRSVYKSPALFETIKNPLE